MIRINTINDSDNIMLTVLMKNPGFDVAVVPKQ